MKAYIRITGEIMGNRLLIQKLGTRSIHGRKGSFNSFVYTYETVPDAKADMQYCYESLREDEPSYTNVSFSKCKEFLHYDASQAVIVEMDY